MKGLFNPDSPLMRFLSRVADMMLLNILWLLCCIPIVTAGAATTAMYHVTLKLAAGEEEGILKTFWRGLKTNFAPATKVFLLLLLPLLFVIGDGVLLLLGVFGDGVLNNVLLALPIVVFSMVWTYVFPLVAKFENPAGVTVKNALLLCVANLPKTILMTALNLFPIVWMILEPVLFARCAVIFLMGGFAWIAYCNGILLNKIFTRLIEQKTATEA